MTSESCNEAAVGKHSQDHYSQVGVRLGSGAARSPLSKYPEMFIQLRDIQPSNASEYQPHMYFFFLFFPLPISQTPGTYVCAAAAEPAAKVEPPPTHPFPSKKGGELRPS